jgi:hypothetical protein
LVRRGIGRHDQTHQSKIEAIKPDQQDFDAVEKEYGPLPPTASQAALAERYRLAQAAKVIRQLEQVAFSEKRRVGSLSNNESGLLTRRLGSKVPQQG